MSEMLCAFLLAAAVVEGLPNELGLPEWKDQWACSAWRQSSACTHLELMEVYALVKQIPILSACFFCKCVFFTLIIDDESKHNACLFFVSSHDISLVLVVIGVAIFSILKKISVQLQWRCVHGLLVYL
jgi:aerobic-type carbon monoxide dehydrogenase small subunit (CoxS/CutS family)